MLVLMKVACLPSGMGEQACAPQTEAEVMTVGSPGNVVSRDITPSAQKRTAAQPSQLTAAPGKRPSLLTRQALQMVVRKRSKRHSDQTKFVRGVTI